MAARRFRQVDVFTATALAGNPVAVVLDADGLDDATMQRLAAWTNLSETTFVLPPTAPGASYRLRIFTQRSEIPFAGHPTIGSAHAVLEAGIASPHGGALCQECGAGVLTIRTDGGRLAVRVPEATVRREVALGPDELARALGAPPTGDPLAIDVGPVWLVARLADVATVRGLAPDLGAIDRLARRLGSTGVTVFAVGDDRARPVVVRSFAPPAGVAEDPVCGSGNAAVGAYLGATGGLDETGPAYRASQGREVGRDGTVEVRVADGGRAVEIAGTAAPSSTARSGSERRRALLRAARAAGARGADDAADGRAVVRRRLDLADGAAVDVGRAGERRVRLARPGGRRGHDDTGVGRDLAGDEPGLAAHRTGGAPGHLALAVDRNRAGDRELLHDVRDAAHVAAVIRGALARALLRDRRLDRASRGLAVGRGGHHAAGEEPEPAGQKQDRVSHGEFLLMECPDGWYPWSRVVLPRSAQSGQPKNPVRGRARRGRPRGRSIMPRPARRSIVAILLVIPLATQAKKPAPVPCPTDVALGLAAACPCDGRVVGIGATQPWKNHGQYVSCSVHYRNALRRSGCLGADDRHTIARCAARSTCGKGATILCCTTATGTCTGDPAPGDSVKGGICSNDAVLACDVDADCVVVTGTLGDDPVACAAAGGVVAEGSVCSGCVLP
jgi:PhzF family phenazine biosynthesis protein